LFLKNQYSTLDAPTVLAILFDYDLSDPLQLETAINTLDILKVSADAEEKTGFDASGSSGPAAKSGNENEYGQENDSGSSKSPPGWSSCTDETPLSQDLSSLDLEHHLCYEQDGGGQDYGVYGLEISDLDEAGKESLLCEMFPALKPFDIKWSLKKKKGDAAKVIDELMTQSFLEENGSRYRGIEAFSETDLSLPRKPKGKKRRNRPTEDIASSPVSESPGKASKWTTAARDIEFISSKTGMPTQQVNSIYHKNGALVHSTITAIIEAHLALGLELDDPIILINANDLSQEFPSIRPSHLSALVQITHPSTAHAHELAKALLVPQTNGKPIIDLEFRHAPLQLDSSPSKPHSHNAVSSSQHTFESATALAAKHTEIRDTAFQQAHAAYRRGKSDHLMGGAAAYYSQEGRDADARLRVARRVAAEKLVESQSFKGGVDLHGVSVEDAKRITGEKVREWWQGLGEERKGEFRIVTGKGNNSERGVGKLGPAVGKMLIREGWKVEVTPGFLVIKGLAKRR
jgi:hypothetical protein